MKKSVVTTILVLAGDRPSGLAREALLAQLQESPRPWLVAVDGGALYLDELGIRPDIIIGDGDSSPQALFADVPRQAYPAQKNFTDGEAAFAYALARDEGDISVFAGLGGRTDHLLTNLFLPCNWPKQIERFYFFGDDCEICYSLGYAEIFGNPDDLVSIFPLVDVVKGITLTNLAYPLYNYNLHRGSSRCLSNVMTSEQATVQHQEGMVLISHIPKNFLKE